jgi:hypothetical protein
VWPRNLEFIGAIITSILFEIGVGLLVVTLHIAQTVLFFIAVYIIITVLFIM